MDRKSKPYVIGFTNKVNALTLKESITLEPFCHLLRNNISEVSDELNTGLRKFGIDSNLSDFTIDVDAKLTIMKKDQDDKRDYNLILETMDYGEFLLTPITRHVGVVMPTDLILEDRFKFEYLCQVIDPVEDLNVMREGLSDLFRNF